MQSMWCGRFLLVGLASVLLAGCAALPKVTDKAVSSALPTPSSGALMEVSRQLASEQASGESSLLLLESNREALSWRLALIDSAQSSIDIQLYLWYSDASGTLLLDRLLKAADRGVRVRLLVDDFLFSGSDRLVAALSRHHPHLEVRIFNPKHYRGNQLSAGASFLTRFKKLNRRMHNKTWTVDRCMSIVGGRNVADHYFGVDPHYNFVDLDVLVTGPVVQEISDGFDQFWNSTGAYPGAVMTKRGTEEQLLKWRRGLPDELADVQEELQSFPLEPLDWSQKLARLPETMVSGRVQFVQDQPEVEDDDRQVLRALNELAPANSREVIYVTPYLIPSRDGLQNLHAMIADGIQVHVLVPSLAANNQALVHGHYKKHRKAILDAGADLFELRSELSPEALDYVDVPPVATQRSCLHAKAMVGDRERCFIGSLNLDPRAMDINTECGLIIDSAAFTEELMAYLKMLAMPQNAWQVTLDDRGRLRWSSTEEERAQPPKAGFGARIQSTISGLLPIRGQL